MKRRRRQSRARLAMHASVAAVTTLGAGLATPTPHGLPMSDFWEALRSELPAKYLISISLSIKRLRSRPDAETDGDRWSA
jgi:hypothetical protein